MSLLDPSVGDLVDRLSILKLKIQFGEEAQKSIGHFETERAAVLHRLNGVNLSTPEIDKLFFVNEAIWTTTDEMRTVCDAHDEPKQARFGRIILRLNDQRAELIQTINRQHGDSRIEKL